MKKKCLNAAIEMLYKNHHQFVVMMLYRKILDIHLSEEFAHDIFVKIIEGGYIVNIPSSLQRKYLSKCIKNLLSDYYKALNSHNHESYTDNMLLTYNRNKTTENCFLEGEIMSTLHDALDKKMTDQEMYIIRKKYFENENITTICKKIKLSRYRFRRILRKATDKVREELTPYFQISR
ncbi:MAG TPA: sigma-70 family RNA polymerase sigma factor [Spirochaetota bacterium]|nr:sigma-70 family RNA polymerase sigma factor [Spirochaetota bacterium]